MKRIYCIFLSAVLVSAIACKQGAMGLDDYDQEIYRPRYASGFEIVGAEGRQSTILKVFNPWQGAENSETMLFIARNGEETPAGFPGRSWKRGQGVSSVCLRPMWRCSMHWDRRTG